MEAVIKTKKLSLYRTEHIFPFYREIVSEDCAVSVIKEAETSGRKVYFLGNGSNTFFQNKIVRSAIVKNRLDKKIESLGDGCYYISSSVLVSEVLKFCLKLDLDCFYFLASVPAEVGGALAMNAGQGLAFGGLSIMDYVEEVRYIKDGVILEKAPQQLNVSYRKTIFTGQNGMFILGATFRFPKAGPFEENPIKARIAWAKKSQDLSKPNCGTVFKLVNMRIFQQFRGLTLFGASYSKKTNNWIINESQNPLGIKILVLLVIVTHRIFFQKCETEIIRIK